MKKMMTYVVGLTFAALSATAMACPKGTTLQGGTGPNHKGGKCVAVTAKKVQAKKTEVKSTEAKKVEAKKTQATKQAEQKTEAVVKKVS
ncbi:hypothetical protein F4V57_08555 [Acinetobacter qingfengensis]|nr:hypothetical protein [Acinetobacter qingfengensis]KAA8733267.1 hypothetical protein F4V57_08555 [Acinetobacter qingfengensis]